MNKTNFQDDVLKSKPITFHTTILKSGQNNTGIQVPEEIIETLGSSKRPLVKVTIKNFTYRSAVAVMDGKYMISLSAENRAAAKVSGGDEVDVTIELDLEPRLVVVPDDLEDCINECGCIQCIREICAINAERICPTG